MDEGTWKVGNLSWLLMRQMSKLKILTRISKYKTFFVPVCSFCVCRHCRGFPPSHWLYRVHTSNVLCSQLLRCSHGENWLWSPRPAKVQQLSRVRKTAGPLRAVCHLPMPSFYWFVVLSLMLHLTSVGHGQVWTTHRSSDTVLHP